MDQRMMRYLIDTNILIYYFADTIPQKEISAVEGILLQDSNNKKISMATKTENNNELKRTPTNSVSSFQFVPVRCLNNRIQNLS